MNELYFLPFKNTLKICALNKGITLAYDLTMESYKAFLGISPEKGYYSLRELQPMLRDRLIDCFRENTSLPEECARFRLHFGSTML